MTENEINMRVQLSRIEKGKYALIMPAQGIIVGKVYKARKNGWLASAYISSREFVVTEVCKTRQEAMQQFAFARTVPCAVAEK